MEQLGPGSEHGREKLWRGSGSEVAEKVVPKDETGRAQEEVLAIMDERCGQGDELCRDRGSRELGLDQPSHQVLLQDDTHARVFVMMAQSGKVMIVW